MSVSAAILLEFMLHLLAKNYEALEGGSWYPFKYFEKYPTSLKRNWKILSKFTQIQKALYHHIPTNTMNVHKSIPYTFVCLANIPISIKTLPGPQLLLKDIRKETTKSDHDKKMLQLQSEKGGKDQESTQSRTTPDPGYHMGQRQKHN